MFHMSGFWDAEGKLIKIVSNIINIQGGPSLPLIKTHF